MSRGNTQLDVKFDTILGILDKAYVEYMGERMNLHPSWENMHPERLYGMAVKLFAKVILAEEEDEALESLIDLILLLMMLASRTHDAIESPDIPF